MAEVQIKLNWYCCQENCTKYNIAMYNNCMSSGHIIEIKEKVLVPGKFLIYVGCDMFKTRSQYV